MRFVRVKDANTDDGPLDRCEGTNGSLFVYVRSSCRSSCFSVPTRVDNPATPCKGLGSKSSLPALSCLHYSDSSLCLRHGQEGRLGLITSLPNLITSNGRRNPSCSSIGALCHSSRLELARYPVNPSEARQADFALASIGFDVPKQTICCRLRCLKSSDSEVSKWSLIPTGGLYRRRIYDPRPQSH